MDRKKETKMKVKEVELTDKEIKLINKEVTNLLKNCKNIDQDLLLMKLFVQTGEAIAERTGFKTVEQLYKYLKEDFK